MSAPNRGSRPLKEAIFVQVKTADDNFIFFDETAKLGRKMPYDRPESTCAMRATADAVVFSLLKYSNKTRAAAVESRLELPRGPLDRTERRAESLGADLPADMIAVEVDDAVHHLKITRDENGVASLETAEGDDATFELPRQRVRATVVLRSPRSPKVVAVAFQGHVGKPGATETVPRVAAIALNHFAGLPVFRMVSGIETVNVPASPARYQAARPVLKDSDRVRQTVPVRLWTADVQAVAAGHVEVEVDLETASPTSGRLLLHLRPVASPEGWAASGLEDFTTAFEQYRKVAAETVLNAMTRHLGPDEIADLVFSIALGELGAGDIERLREALGTVTGLDVSPKEGALFSPQA